MRTCLFLLCIIISSTNLSFSQPCKVAFDSAQGSYTGDCKDGKACGKGKFEWKNGSVYDGNWKNGQFDGFGVLISKISTDSSTVESGYWKKGKFISKYEKPYSTNILTNNISDLSIRKNNGTQSEIWITIRNASGGASTLSTPVLPKSIITNMQVLNGVYQEMVVDSGSRVTTMYRLKQVSFPFAAILTFDSPGQLVPTEQAKIEILENGRWNINVTIEN